MAPATTTAAAQQPQLRHQRLGLAELPSDWTGEEAAWATVRARVSCMCSVRAVLRRGYGRPGGHRIARIDGPTQPIPTAKQLKQALPEQAAWLRRMEALEQSVQQRLVRKRRLSTLHMLGPSLVRARLRMHVLILTHPPFRLSRFQNASKFICD